MAEKTGDLVVVDRAEAVGVVVQGGLTDLMTRVDEVAQQHEEFYVSYVVGGRKALYKLLSSMLGVVQMVLNSVEKEQLIKDCKHVLRNSGIKTQSNSSDVAVMVRYMTRTDRKTTHVYARAIEAALAQGIGADGFSNFAEESGGLENIRALSVTKLDGSDSANADSTDYVAMTKEFLYLRTLVPVGKFEGTEGINRVESSSAVSYEYMVCVRRGDSSYDILTKIPADGEFEAQVIEHIAKGFKRNPASNVKGMEGLRMAAKKVYAEQRGMADEDFKLASSTAVAEEQKQSMSTTVVAATSSN